MGLNRRQQSFATYYVLDPERRRTEAARKAGYKNPKGAACQLWGNQEVRAEIERRLANVHEARLEAIAKAASKGTVTREQACEELADFIEECQKAGPGAWQMQNRLKAMELRYKISGVLTEKVDLGLDDKLIELLESGRKRAGIVAVTPVIKGELIAAAN